MKADNAIAVRGSVQEKAGNKKISLADAIMESLIPDASCMTSRAPPYFPLVKLDSLRRKLAPGSVSSPINTVSIP